MAEPKKKTTVKAVKVVTRKSPMEVVGVVTKSQMDKTIAVEAYRLERHAKYGKYLSKSSTYKAHDEKNEAKVGDKVRIFESRPISKSKYWRLGGVIEAAIKGKEK